MQNMLRRTLVVLAGLAGMIPVGAGAMTITHTPIGAPLCLSANAPAACNTGGGSAATYSFSFDLSGVADEIIAATLTLQLSDDMGRADGSEKIDLTVNGVDLQVNGDANSDFLISLADPGSLGGTTLNIIVGAETGDYFFAGATLTLTVEEQGTDEILPQAAVPVPPSMVLLGLGLVAVAARRRA
jgi:hypothetical protein